MKRTIFLFMITLMVSCKNDIPDVKENSHLLSTVESRAIAIHPKYNALGWGYDITGSQMSYRSVKAPVIDIYKFDSENIMISLLMIHIKEQKGHIMQVIQKNI